MNKLYKVIWSKAKHTYVVASEIAKGHTKGETTGKGLKKLAAAMLVAAALLSPNFAWAADTTKVEPAPDGSATAVEVYTKAGADKAISTNATNISTNATNINTNAKNILSNTEKISKLESAVGDGDSGLKKDVNDLKTTVGDSTGGLVKDVADSKTAIDTEKTAREAGDKALDDRITAVKNYVLKETGDNYVSKADAAVQDAGVVKANKKIGENVTALGKGLYDETAARIGADAAQDKVIKQVNDNLVASVNTINKNVADGFTALNQAGANEAAAREAKDNELNERITNEANEIHKTTNKLQSDLNTETVAREAADTALDTRITNVKEYLEKQTSDTYVSKDDAAVQDGAIVKADKTIGENVTNLDAALAKETAARLGADAAQDKVIQQVNANLVESVTTINKNVADGFTALNQADANELAGRVAADKELVKATNGGLALNDKNVLQKNETIIAEDGTVKTTTTAADTLIMNEGKTNQITLSENGIKVGLNSGVMDKDGFYAGGDTADAAKAALNADGSIKGAGGGFTVDGTTGNVSTKGSLAAASGTIGNVSMSADGTVTGVKDLTASGKVTAGSFTDGTATMSNGSLNGVNQINATGNIVTTGNMQAHDMTATGTITGQNINGTTGTFGSLSTTGNASVGGTLTTNGIINTGNATTDTLTVNHNATVGGNLGVTGDITGKSLNVGTGDIKGGQITGTGLDVGAGTIKTTGAVATGTLTTTGDATIGGDLDVKGDLSVEGEFNAKTLSSKLDENNYTTINGGKTESMNLKMDKKTGEIQASASTFDETGSNAWARDDDSKGLSTITADSVKQSISDVRDNVKNYASRELSQNTDNKYEIADSVVEGNQSNVENRTADTTDSQIFFKDDSGKVLNKSYITQNLKKVLMGVEEGDNKTTIEQDANNISNTAKNGTIKNDAGKLVNTASDTIANMAGNDITNTSTNGNIANTAANGTISNNAKNLTNTASENITNKAENGNISNIASNGTISNEAKTISNKADEALTNDAKTITNTASESVTTQIGDGSEVQSVMNGGGIANKATGKSITNDAAKITNTGTTSVTNQVGNNKVLVDTTHVQSAFGDTIYTTWDESGITNNATDKTVATNAKNIQNTATGDITNTASTGTITNDAKTLLNTASDSITDKVGENVERTMTTKKISESVKDGTKSNTFSKTAEKDISIITDGTTTSTLSQLANSVNTSFKNGTQSLNNTKTVTEDVTKVTDTTTGAFSSSSQKADSITSTVKDTEKGTISERSQTVSQVQDKVGTTTVTTTDGLTKLTNEAGKHNTQMDFAEVLKDLGVRGNAVVDGTLEVGGKSTFKDDVTMEKNLHVKGTTTTDKLVVDNGATIKGGATVTGGTTTDTLHVTSTSTFDGKATFKDIVTMEKDLSVGGNATVAGDVTANSYKVGDKTYIDKDGINANNQVIRNVGQGNISEGSTDAVSGGQLYETNTRVSGLENRMGTVETKVDKLDGKIDKVGANAAAMANLHPPGIR